MKKRTSGKWISRLFVLLLSLVLFTAGFGRNILAEESGFDQMGSKEASPTELKGEERETTVTLSLPSGEYENEVDIVFVMDNSTSVANAGLNFAENASELFEKIVAENEGIDLKVGVVKFRGYATDMLGTELTPYTDETKDTITAAIANTSVPGSGSNLHSGLVMAGDMLDADTEVEDANKYVIVLTDCKSYIWNNEANEPVTYYAQYAQRGSLKNSGKPMLNQWAPLYNKESGKVYTTLPQIEDHTPFNMLSNNTTWNWSATGLENGSEYYQYLYDSENDEIAATDTKYDSPCYYSKYYPEGTYTGSTMPGDGPVVNRTLTNGAEIFNINGQQVYRTYYDYTPQEGTFWADISYLELNPYEVVQNADGTYSYDTEKVNEDFWMWHPSNTEKGIYQAGHYFKEELDSKYNTAVIATYKSDDGAGSHICGSFRTWLFENSDMSADVLNTDDVLQLFTDIDNSVRYMVSKGTVTDVIGDDFTLKNPDSADCFRMTHEGNDLTVTFADGVWNFGEPNDAGVYPYVVSYADGTKTITLTINVPIENLKPITLSYDLILKDECAIDDTYHDTNVSAVLDYVSTDGKKDGSFVFTKPNVHYVNPPADEKNPQTGDTERLMILSAVAMLTAAGAVTAAVVIRKKDRAV